ncbi:MAG TPA: hypothetical protein VHQ87_05160 [Rhizobacter sp.]|nr:hypothetical protein [Rhizobacter sp.]
MSPDHSGMTSARMHRLIENGLLMTLARRIATGLAGNALNARRWPRSEGGTKASDSAEALSFVDTQANWKDVTDGSTE